MGLSKLSPVCAACPIVSKCNNKCMEALAYLEPAAAEVTEDVSAPILRETMQINVGGVIQTVYKDDIEKMLRMSLFKDRYVGLNYGA